MADLFSSEFVDAISRLRIKAKNIPRGGRHAEQTSIQMGSGMEFRDFRPYTAGDDFRRIDWILYSRSGMLFLRLFEEVRDLPVYILLDCSDSMYFENPPRADAGRQMAASLAAAALNQHDRPGIYPFGEQLLQPLRSITSSRALPGALNYLEELPPSGETNLPGALRQFSSMRHRSGLMVVISDFFHPGGFEEVAESLRSLRHRLLMVQISRASDAEPEVSGEVELLDCESGVGVQTTITPRVLQRYRQRYQAFQQEILDFVNHRQAGYLMLDSDRDVLAQLSEIFINGIFTARG